MAAMLLITTKVMCRASWQKQQKSIYCDNCHSLEESPWKNLLCRPQGAGMGRICHQTMEYCCAGHPGKNKRNVWVVARQHPGEAMAQWFMEGFLDRLTDPHDAASMRVLEHAVFYVVSMSSQQCTLTGFVSLDLTTTYLQK